MNLLNNELRRTKQKLAILDIEGINGVIGDLLENLSTAEKIYTIAKLKMKYQTLIQELEKPDLKQQKLFK